MPCRKTFLAAAIVAFALLACSVMAYTIRLYTNSQPSDVNATLVKTCDCGSNQTCDCIFTYTSLEAIYAKAETWNGTTKLSNSSWIFINYSANVTGNESAPYFTEFSYSGHINYFNIFWNVTYESMSKVNVSCIFDCDPRMQNCAGAQKCDPYPKIQYPGGGGCTVLNPMYSFIRRTKIVCKITDAQNADIVRWYPTNPE